MNAYANKNSAYFAHARTEIDPLLAPHCGRVLELGCGAGATLGRLRDLGRTSATVGLEISAAAAQQARSRVDCVHTLDLERDPWPDLGAPFDTILCLDVLEHLIDPWRMVDQLVRTHLAPGGRLVVSLPNVRHFSVLLPLLMQGRWQYADDGILDRTHLRFFTRSSAMALFTGMGCTIHTLRSSGLERGRKSRWFNMLTLSVFQPFLEYQFLLDVRKESV